MRYVEDKREARVLLMLRLKFFFLRCLQRSSDCFSPRAPRPDRAFRRALASPPLAATMPSLPAFTLPLTRAAMRYDAESPERRFRAAILRAVLNNMLLFAIFHYSRRLVAVARRDACVYIWHTQLSHMYSSVPARAPSLFLLLICRRFCIIRLHARRALASCHVRRAAATYAIRECAPLSLSRRFLHRRQPAAAPLSPPTSRQCVRWCASDRKILPFICAVAVRLIYTALAMLQAGGAIHKRAGTFERQCKSFAARQ